MDMYEGVGRGPANSVNFITAHDGFTLYDLVAYNEKHNDANGEGNRDGIDDNLSWNCGVEGPTDDPGINVVPRTGRSRTSPRSSSSRRACRCSSPATRSAARSTATTTPTARTTSSRWFDWTLVEKNADLFRFFKQMIGLRRRHASLRRRSFLDRRPQPARRRGHPLARPRARPAALGRRRLARARLHARRARTRSSPTCT